MDDRGGPPSVTNRHTPCSECAQGSGKIIVRVLRQTAVKKKQNNEIVIFIATAKLSAELLTACDARAPQGHKMQSKAS